MSPSKRSSRGTEPTAAQARVIAAALKLFSEHGVGGTSLRMIATDLGVTVAAVYHQYRTKDDIIFAAVECELLRLQRVVEAAEAEPEATRAREALVTGMVDLTFGTGRSISTVLSDPAVTGSFSDHAGFRNLMYRMCHLLMGGDSSPEARFRTALLIAAINGTATHPLVADLDDELLRSELLLIVQCILSRGGHGQKGTAERAGPAIA